MRTALITALVACADESQRLWARRFLTGLSADEMEFIAEFLGASILEAGPEGVPRAALPQPRSRGELAERIEAFQWTRKAQADPSGGRPWRHSPSRDTEHKMILLLEYLCRGAIRQHPVPLPSARA